VLDPVFDDEAMLVVLPPIVLREVLQILKAFNV